MLFMTNPKTLCPDDVYIVEGLKKAGYDVTVGLRGWGPETLNAETLEVTAEVGGKRDRLPSTERIQAPTVAIYTTSHFGKPYPHASMENFDILFLGNLTSSLMDGSWRTEKPLIEAAIAAKKPIVAQVPAKEMKLQNVVDSDLPSAVKFEQFVTKQGNAVFYGAAKWKCHGEPLEYDPTFFENKILPKMRSLSR